MENRFLAMLVVMVVVVLFAIGFAVNEQSIDIAGCKASWKNTATTVDQSELCSQARCVAEPAYQQHNAIVDALVCACQRVRDAGYTDDTANTRIEEVFSLAMNYQAGVQEICENPGAIMAKRAYG